MRLPFKMIAGTYCLCIAWSEIQAQAVAPSLAQIQSAWTTRREALPTVRIRMEYKETIPKGSFSKQLPPPLARGEPQPPSEVVHNGTCTFVIKGSKGRVSRESMTWHVSQKQFNKGSTDSVIESKQFKTFVKYGGQEWPTGRISKEGWATESDLILWPLLLALRGDDKEVVGSGGLDGMETIRPIVFEGRSLVELARLRDEQRGERKLWVDPVQAFCPIRHDTYARSGELESRVVVVQTRAVKSNWIPVKWIIDEYSGASLLRHVDVAVSQLDLDSVSDFDLELDFPVGTYVTDATKAKREEYIVKEFTKRIVLPEERAVGYQALVSSETGEIHPHSRNLSIWGWILSLLGFLAILTAITWSYRHWKHRRLPSTDSSPNTPKVGGIT